MPMFFIEFGKHLIQPGRVRGNVDNVGRYVTAGGFQLFNFSRISFEDLFGSSASSYTVRCGPPFVIDAECTEVVANLAFVS